MANKIVFGVLSALLLIQHGYTTPVSEPKPEMDDDQLFDRGLLLLFAASNFGALINETVVEGKDMLKLVIEDPKAAEDEAELTKMKTFIQKVEEYEKQDETHRQIGTLMDLFTEMAFLLEDYDAETPNEKHSAIDAILDNSAMKQIGTAFEEGFKVFAEKLMAAISKYLSDLTEEQRVKEQALIDWTDKFAAETKVEKQVGMLYLFVEIF